MELAFETKSLRTTCESEANARSELGESLAEMLRHRLADLSAATSVHDLVAGNARAVDGTDHFAVQLDEEHRLVLSANHPKNPIGESGGISWENVSRIKILRIEGSS